MKDSTFRGAMILTVLLVAVIIVGGVYLITRPPEKQPAEALPSFTHVNFYWVNPRNNVNLTPTSSTFTSGTFTASPTPAAGKSTVDGMPAGTYTVKALATGYYDLDTTQKVSGSTDEISYSIPMDKMGTFGWGDTLASDAATHGTDQTLSINIYLRNTGENSVIKGGYLTIDEGSDNATLLTMETTSHSFAVDDFSHQSWAVNVGDIEANQGVTVTLRMHITSVGTSDTIVLNLRFDDLGGKYVVDSLAAATKTVTITTSS